MTAVTRIENLTEELLTALGKTKIPVELLHEDGASVPIETVKAMLECGSKFTFTSIPSSSSPFTYGLLIGSLSARGTEIGYLIGENEDIPECEVKNVRFYKDVKSLIADNGRKRTPAKRAAKKKPAKRATEKNVVKEQKTAAPAKEPEVKPEPKKEPAKTTKKVLPDYDDPSGMNPPETPGDVLPMIAKLGSVCRKNAEAVKEALKECVDYSSFEIVLSDKVTDENEAYEICELVKPKFDELMAAAQ